MAPNKDGNMSAPTPIPELFRLAYTIPEACAITGVGREGIYAAIRDGHLTARKFGRRTLITDDALRQFLAGLPRAGARAGA
jgi:excisionase family DNA binding protein